MRVRVFSLLPASLNLAVLADADHQQVQVPGLLVELGAVLGDELLGDRAVGDVDVLLADVHLVQQHFVEAVVAALERVLGGRIVFVDGDDLHVPEGNQPGLVAAGEFVVQGGGGGAGGQAQAEQPPFRRGLDGVDHEVGHRVGSGPGFGVDLGPDFFIVVQDALREILLDQASLVRQGEVFFAHNWLSLSSKVLPWRMSPVCRPFLSHFMRWAAVPWVKDSSTA